MTFERTMTFVLKPEHLRLLDRAWIGWQDCEFGAPEVDPKRPYGNSDVVGDIAEILGWELFEDSYGERHLSPEQYETANQLHRETQVALQIIIGEVCRGMPVELGTYRKNSPYGQDWEYVGGEDG